MKLEDKTAVVTGAAAGLGRATAIGAAREGARLVLADIDEAGGEATARQISEEGGTARFVHTDLGRSADVRRLMDTAGERFGRLDILINPAAILPDPANASRPVLRGVLAAGDRRQPHRQLPAAEVRRSPDGEGGGRGSAARHFRGRSDWVAALLFRMDRARGGSGGWFWSPGSSFAPSTFASTPWPRGRWRPT